MAARFGLGSVIDCTPITEGLMNPNWRLTTTAGVFALKQLRDATPAAARRQESVLPLLAAYGVPVPEVRGGEVGGHYYLVARWMPGTHRLGSSLPLGACRALGDLVGRIHIGLTAALPNPPPLPDHPRTVADARADLERLGRLATADCDVAPGGFDRFAVGEIAGRLRLLDAVGHLRPADESDVQPAGWTHGDLTDLNLLFDGDAVCGVLDWDRLGVRPYGLEVVRTASIMFEIGDLERVRAFAVGYRGRVDIGDDALGDAARRRWWALVTDTYFLRRHYDLGDSACDHLLRRSAEVLRWWTPHRDAFDAALRVG